MKLSFFDPSLNTAALPQHSAAAESQVKARKLDFGERWGRVCQLLYFISGSQSSGAVGGKDGGEFVGGLSVMTIHDRFDDQRDISQTNAFVDERLHRFLVRSVHRRRQCAARPKSAISKRQAAKV